MIRFTRFSCMCNHKFNPMKLSVADPLCGFFFVCVCVCGCGRLCVHVMRVGSNVSFIIFVSLEKTSTTTTSLSPKNYHFPASLSVSGNLFAVNII